MPRFENDYKCRNVGIRIKFDGTDESHHFLWDTVIDFPTTFMFFGALLTQCRSFDSIFQDCRSISTVHHHSICYYCEFEGDVQACLALYNAYQHRHAYIFVLQVGRLQRGQKKYDKNLLKSTAVVNFLDAIDDCCRSASESDFIEFKDHSCPIVETDEVLHFIWQALTVFGDFWGEICECRGVTNCKVTRSSSSSWRESCQPELVEALGFHIKCIEFF